MKNRRSPDYNFHVERRLRFEFSGFGILLEVHYHARPGFLIVLYGLNVVAWGGVARAEMETDSGNISLEDGLLCYR